MPRNKKESLVFTTMMCAVMVLCMSAYNVARIHGIGEHYLRNVLFGFPLGFAVAYAADWFVVGPVAKKIAYKFIKDEDPIIKKVLIISSCMVTSMLIIMFLFGAVMGVGISALTLKVWMINIPLNFIVALPLQIVVAGPLVRFGFTKIYPAAA